MSRGTAIFRLGVRLGLIVVLLGLTLGVWTSARQSELAVPARRFADKPWIPQRGKLSGSEAEWLDRARILHQTPDAEFDPRVIFIGDSLTENWSHHAPDVWERFYGERRALNLGIWGDKTQHTLWRLTAYPVDRFDPEVVVMLIGINNIPSDPPEHIARGIVTLARLVRKQLPGARILLMGLLPAASDPQRRPGGIGRVNDILEEWARTAEVDPTFLDISDAFLDERGRIPRQFLIDDVHLSKEGYEIWAESIEPTLAQWLEPARGAEDASGREDLASSAQPVPEAGRDTPTTPSVARH